MSLKPFIYKTRDSQVCAWLAAVLIIAALMAPADLLALHQGKNTRQNAIQSFASGNYERAYAGFKELLSQFPRDPLYKYYAGASLVETGKDPALAVDLLRQAMDAASFKKLPEDARFYLGRAEHMQGNFKEAIAEYNRFAAESGKKAAREKKITALIEQCRKGEGKSPKAGIAVAVASQPSAPSKREPLPPEIEKQTGDNLEKHFRDDSAQRANSRKQNEPAAIKSGTDPGPAEKKPETASSVTTAVQTSVQDSVRLKEILARQSGVLTLFEILPGPVTDQRARIEINPALPEGLVHMIQIGVFRNPQPLAFFKGISPIYGFRNEGASSTIYCAGMFRRMADATKALSSVRAKGFRDAFVVARMNGKTISKDRSAVLEKDWGNAPLFNVMKGVEAAEADTVPPALVFRVEVARSKQPLNAETVSSFVKFAGDKGLDVRQIEDGSYTYLIGTFITFESAEEYSGLLRRNGYQDAKVTAWLGRKEIDVNTAKQLFENLE